jgi:hypothetical protein
VKGKIGVKGWYAKDYHYSRYNSRKFWKRVNAIVDQPTHMDLYKRGCLLQNMEEQVLRLLKEAEKNN